MLINSSEYQNIIRTNKTWIALICGSTDENEKQILHNFRMVKFEMPENEAIKKRKVDNCQQDAIWFYLNHLDSFSTMSNDRMINAEDLDKNILEAIPYKTLPFRELPATIQNYIQSGLFGYPQIA